MDIDTITKDVKDRFDTASERAQKAAKQGAETVKTSTDLVVNSAQDLYKTNSSVAKDLAEASKASFDKAVKDGVVAVAQNPLQYIPEGRDKIVGAFSTTVDSVAKTGEKLVKVVRDGFGNISVTLNGKPAKKPAAKRTAAKKPAAKKTTASKTTAKKTTASSTAAKASTSA